MKKLIFTVLLIGCGVEEDNTRVTNNYNEACHVQESGRLIMKECGSPDPKIIDPCGDGYGDDEILFFFSEGTYVRQTEQGLIVLSEDVRYRTNDNQQCAFYIEDGILKHDIEQ